MGEGYRATIEWGFWKFIKYLIVPSVISWFASWIATRYFSLDTITWTWLVWIHLANPWIFIPETASVLGTFYIIKWSRASEKKSRQKRATDYIKKLYAEGGGEPIE